METEIIDELFLELSQFTTARTKRELELENKIWHLEYIIKNLKKKRMRGKVSHVKKIKRD